MVALRQRVERLHQDRIAALLQALRSAYDEYERRERALSPERREAHWREVDTLTAALTPEDRAVLTEIRQAGDALLNPAATPAAIAAACRRVIAVCRWPAETPIEHVLGAFLRDVLERQAEL